MGWLALLNLAMVASAATSTSGSQVEVIRQIPQSGAAAAGSSVPGLSCLSWRVGVEAHNIIDWETVPMACKYYVGNYMLGLQYRKDSSAVTNEALTYAKGLQLGGDGKDIWVFDIDETSLSNLPYFADHGFGADPPTWELYGQWIGEGKAPALPESLKLYKELLSLGFKIAFITGRSESYRSVSAQNLKNEGYHTWNALILKGSADANLTAIAYKSIQRKKLEQDGYRIRGNIGDQWSDLLGTHVGNRTFKLPNPMYFLP